MGYVHRLLLSLTHVREPEFCNPGNFYLWNPESKRISLGFVIRMQLKESRIHVPLTKTGMRHLESGIQGVESRIQDCIAHQPDYGIFLSHIEAGIFFRNLKVNLSKIQSNLSVRTDISLIRTPLYYGQFPMSRQNYHIFYLKNPLQYGLSLIRTTDTKSRPQ